MSSKARIASTFRPTNLAELRSMALGAALIALQLTLTFLVGSVAWLALSILPGFPAGPLPLPVVVRWFGLVPLGAGVGIAYDTFRYRPPKPMLISTSVTLQKLFGRRPLQLPAERSEPFTVVGPYRYVRNPLYLGVVLIVFGGGLLASSAILLLWGLSFLGWFWFVLIPFEEKELGALLGESYERYRKRVPKLFPFRPAYSGPERGG